MFCDGFLGFDPDNDGCVYWNPVDHCCECPCEEVCPLYGEEATDHA